MLVDDMIRLEARNPALNCWREWRIELGQDLFGAWTVDIQFGRIGSRGCLLRHAFTSQAEAHAFARRGLQRRATAPARIGVAYRCVRASTDMCALLAQFNIKPMQG